MYGKEYRNRENSDLYKDKFMKKYIKRFVIIIGLLLAALFIANVLFPYFCKHPTSEYAREVSQMGEGIRSEQEANGEKTENSERIRCIDDNEEALIWRLRMIGAAKESVVLSTFDLRADDSGSEILAALYHAADRGVQVQLLIDGIYQKLFLDGNKLFQALSAHENVEVRIYNPITVTNLFRLNYRMHDKYIIVDERMYLLGGRNTNDIFLGDKQTGINADRDILMYDTSDGESDSLLELEDYFERIWNEDHVSRKKDRHGQECYTEQYHELEAKYDTLRKKYMDIDTYDNWEEDTFPVDKITLIDNGTQAGRKNPQVLQAIEALALQGENVIIQTPYVICNDYMYGVLEHISEKADTKVILNAVEKGSNPWGCTDYLNQKQKILDTGVMVYELMNEHAVHTKVVLVDDDISIVGSYNLDMRSTYLDTELMLVIESQELNEQIRATEDTYIEKSKEVCPDGQETEGSLYKEKTLNKKKQMFYSVLRILVRPFRHLL